MKLHMTRVNPSAHLPVYGSEHAACMDFSVPPGNSYTILPGERALIGTGWAVAVPDGYCLQLYSRSGHGAKLNVKLANSVGIIDSDYRGEVMACVYNAGDKSALFLPGDRFVQAMLVATPRIEMDVVSELPVSTRGAGGFGSTGSGLRSLSLPVEEVTINTDNAGTLHVRAVRPRQTHTLATMEVSEFVYKELRDRFVEVGYDHVIGNEDGDGEFLDMTGIAIKRA